MLADQAGPGAQLRVTRPDVLTGDSFFHLSALGAPLPGLNLCGAGRVVCLIDVAAKFFTGLPPDGPDPVFLGQIARAAT
jgi:hypothetical protein